MPGILTTFGNIGSLIGSLYPPFIVSFLVLASLFNQRLNGLVYLGGIASLLLVSWLVALTGIVPKLSSRAPLSCDLFSLFSHNYQGPSLGAGISWFTLIIMTKQTK